MRRIVTALCSAAIVTGLVGGSLAAAASPNAEGTFVYAVPVEFTLAAGVCPDLPDDLSVDFSGIDRGHLHVSTDANGGVIVNWPDTIFGTAVDSDGNTYTFNYHNVVTVRDSGFPIEVTTTDHFNLVGAGPATQIHAFFVMTVLITETSEEVKVSNAHGAAECDAI
jgi:hypothetical protein